MAEGTYEFECMRAELLGIEIPDKEQYDLAQENRKKAEEDELNTERAAELEKDDENLKGTGSKLDELNSILSTTQQKLNRFKKTACGSLSNMFKGQSVDEHSISMNTDSPENNTTARMKGNLDQTLDNLETIKTNDIKMARHASLDIQNKMTSQIDKLDSILNRTEIAENSMAAQSKQMKKFLK